MNKIKGVNPIASFAIIKDTWGDAGLEKIKAALDEKDRAELFGKKILPSSWVDFGAHIRLNLAADKLFGKGDYALIEDWARKAMQKNFNTIYKLFISFTSPAVILKNFADVWHQNLDTGSVRVELNGPKSATLQLTDYPGIPAQHALLQTPCIDELLRMSSAKAVKTEHTKCLAAGDDCCLWEFSWS